MSAIAELLTAAGLTGRGGGDFPTGAKVELAERHDAELIVNACDGEPGAAKDGWVITHHLPEVLDGARRLTRRRIRVAAHRGSRTLATLRAAGVDTVSVPRRYVSSEESALTRLAHGGPARPVMRYRPVTAGSRTKQGRPLPPTLVLNAETVWRAQQIIERGPAWFRSFGTAREPGPRLVTLVDGVAAPGTYPVEAGMPVREILGLAGGCTGSARALWISGLSGGFLRAEDAETATWSRVGLRPYGIRPGAGTVSVLAAGSDPWVRVRAALTYAAGESAGQCGPCMFGVPAVRDDLEQLASPEPEGANERLRRHLSQLTGRGACHFPDGIAGLLTSALEVFGPPTLP
ncbi:MAG: SLBB domain-containing protein [Nocardia sp.]|nr:SLBB domain-containing protein [Nocardia sp.]